MRTYAAQKGWLEATPEKHNEPRWHVFGRDLPELDDDEYLHLVWHDLGCRSHGENIAPLEWREILAYSEVTGTLLSHEDWRTVMEMSVAYCSGLADRNPLSMSPVERLSDE